MAIIPYLCIVVGLLLVTLSLFLYETQERGIQDVLEQWWNSVDDYERTWAASATLLTRGVANTIGRWLDEMFGAKRRSLRTLIACLGFSLASMLLLSFGFGVYTWFKPVTMPIPPTRVLSFLFGGALIFFVATRQRNGRHYVGGLSVAVALVLGGTTAFFAGTSGHTIGVYAGLVVGALCNYVTLVLGRRLAEYGFAGRWAKFLALAVLNAAIGLCFLIAPMLFMNTGRMRGFTADLLGFGAISTLFAAVVAVAFMLSALVLCAPRVVGSTLSRPLYALQRFRVFQNRKLLFFAGSSLIVVGVPSLAGVIDSAIGLFTR